MINLNSKSILDCNEKEELKHNKEVEKTLLKLLNLPNYNCKFTKQFTDEAHKNKSVVSDNIELHEVLDIIERLDIKNGIDLQIDDDNDLKFIVHGQGYMLDNIHHLITQEVKVEVFDEDNNKLDISDKLIPKEKKKEIEL